MRIAALLVVVSCAACPAWAQEPQAGDGPGLLVERIEAALAAGDMAAFSALFAPNVPAEDIENLTAMTVVEGATRAVVRERDRAAFSGAARGDAYRLVLEIFIERGREAAIYTYRFDVQRVPGSDPPTFEEPGWRIRGQELLTAVQGLFRLGLNPARQFDVRRLTITAEDFLLTIPSGKAFVAETPGGVTALVVLGSGEMRFTPALAAERGQVRLFSGRESLVTSFDAAYIRVSPSDFGAHVAQNGLVAEPVTPRDLARAQAVFDEEVAKSFTLDLRELSRDSWSLVPGFGDFLAEVRTRKYDTLTYARSTGEPEDITLFDRERRRNISIYPSQRRLETRGRSYDEDELADYDVIDYDIQASFQPDREWLDGQARIKLRVRSYALASLTVRLNEALMVHSAVSEQHGRLLVIRIRGQNSFIVNLPKALSRDDVLTVRVRYSGRMPPLPPDREVAGAGRAADQIFSDLPTVVPEPRYVLSNRSYWYPQSPVTDFATARLQLSVPAPFVSVASGSPSASNPMVLPPARPGEPARNVSEFIAGQPVRYLSWAMSRLEAAATASVALAPRQPIVSANGTGSAGASSPGVRYDSLDLAVNGNPRQIAKGRALLGPVEDILGFYAGLMDDLPYPSFTLALVDSDLPGGHSPAYFALLYQPLPTMPFVWRNDPVYFDTFPQFFLAHELAHQYWGQAVGWKSYHEQWVSEGFAQYLAALYAEKSGSASVFRDVVRRMRRSVLDNDDQGPIFLGYRLGHVRGDSRVFRAIVYNKGALVLHMLRRLVGDETFFSSLRHLYHGSRFTKIGTEDVRAAFEAVSGRPLDRFFERWIYESAIPSLRWNWRVDPATPGSVLLRFDQDRAPDQLFDLPVTVELTYADGTAEEIIVAVTEASVERRLPLRTALRSVEVNGDGAALARFDRR